MAPIEETITSQFARLITYLSLTDESWNAKNINSAIEQWAAYHGMSKKETIDYLNFMLFKDSKIPLVKNIEQKGRNFIFEELVLLVNAAWLHRKSSWVQRLSEDTGYRLELREI